MSSTCKKSERIWLVIKDAHPSFYPNVVAESADEALVQVMQKQLTDPEELSFKAARGSKHEFRAIEVCDPGVPVELSGKFMENLRESDRKKAERHQREADELRLCELANKLGKTVVEADGKTEAVTSQEKYMSPKWDSLTRGDNEGNCKYPVRIFYEDDRVIVGQYFAEGRWKNQKWIGNGTGAAGHVSDLGWSCEDLEERKSWGRGVIVDFRKEVKEEGLITAPEFDIDRVVKDD